MISFQERVRWEKVVLILILGLAVVLIGCDGSKTDESEGASAEAQGATEAGGEKAGEEKAGEEKTGEEKAGEEKTGAAAEAPAPGAEAAPGGADNGAGALAGNIYPGFNFALLSAEQRTRFVAIAEAELCPCEGSTESLHVCLQSMDRCGMATMVAGVIGSSIREGLNPTDTLDRVANFVEESQKTYSFTLEGVPYKGSADAKVVIVEFADFQCPHCREAARVLDEVAKRYGDQIAIYFKQFPLGSPEAQIAAQATLAAHKQGKFWPMHDLIFQHQSTLSTSRIMGFARQLGLNYDRFMVEMKNPEISAVIQRDRQEGLAANMQGTPAIFINGKTYLDDKSTAALSRAIDALLKEGGAE